MNTITEKLKNVSFIYTIDINFVENFINLSNNPNKRSDYNILICNIINKMEDIDLNIIIQILSNINYNFLEYVTTIKIGNFLVKLGIEKNRNILITIIDNLTEENEHNILDIFKILCKENILYIEYVKTKNMFISLAIFYFSVRSSCLKKYNSNNILHDYICKIIVNDHFLGVSEISLSEKEALDLYARCRDIDILYTSEILRLFSLKSTSVSKIEENIFNSIVNMCTNDLNKITTLESKHITVKLLNALCNNGKSSALSFVPVEFLTNTFLEELVRGKPYLINYIPEDIMNIELFNILSKSLPSFSILHNSLLKYCDVDKYGVNNILTKPTSIQHIDPKYKNINLYEFHVTKFNTIEGIPKNIIFEISKMMDPIKIISCLDIFDEDYVRIVYDILYKKPLLLLEIDNINIFPYIKYMILNYSYINMADIIDALKNKVKITYLLENDIEINEYLYSINIHLPFKIPPSCSKDVYSNEEILTKNFSRFEILDTQYDFDECRAIIIPNLLLSNIPITDNYITNYLNLWKKALIHDPEFFTVFRHKDFKEEIYVNFCIDFLKMNDNKYLRFVNPKCMKDIMLKLCSTNVKSAKIK